MVLFRKFDESPLVYSGKFEVTPIVKFLESSSVPTLIGFDDDYSEPIYKQRKAAVILFSNKENEDADYTKVFSDAAQQLKGEILFVKSEVKKGAKNKLADMFAVDEASIPAVKIFSPVDSKKYIFSGDAKSLSFDDLKQFINDFKNRKLTPFVKS